MSAGQTLRVFTYDGNPNGHMNAPYRGYLCVDYATPPAVYQAQAQGTTHWGPLGGGGSLEVRSTHLSGLVTLATGATNRTILTLTLPAGRWLVLGMVTATCTSTHTAGITWASVYAKSTNATGFTTITVTGTYLTATDEGTHLKVVFAKSFKEAWGVGKLNLKAGPGVLPTPLRAFWSLGIGGGTHYIEDFDSYYGPAAAAVTDHTPGGVFFTVPFVLPATYRTTFTIPKPQIRTGTTIVTRAFTGSYFVPVVIAYGAGGGGSSLRAIMTRTPAAPDNALLHFAEAGLWLPPTEEPATVTVVGTTNVTPSGLVTLAVTTGAASIQGNAPGAARKTKLVAIRVSDPVPTTPTTSDTD